MTIELVDGRAGKPHINGDDLGDFKAGILGDEGYVFDRGNTLAATLNDANSVTIDTGSGIMPISGRHFRVTSPENATITSGTQGQNRNDLIVLRPTTATDDTTVESVAVVVLRGTPTDGSAADPETEDTDLVLYRIQLTGVSVADPIALFSVMVPYNKFRTSIDQRPKVFTGSKSFGPISGTSVLLFSAAEFEETFGRTYNNSKDFVGVMNGDGASSNCHVDGAQWSSGTGVYATFDRTLSSAWVRVTYVVVLGA